MRKVQIYVNNQLLDLFDDEKIEIKSSVQNIQDISKVFTDFSQSFTVPASDNNNAIFGFYYNNDLNEFNANTRVNCRIEIDLIPFREGKLQLEGSTVKNNQVNDYKVAFYGDVVTLKDLIGEDKLRDLDYSGISITQSGADVQSSITSSAYQDVRFPLISSGNVWTYGDGGAYDISDITKPIVYNELFPAISDSKILDLIAQTYGVTFTGNFLTDNRFKNSYTWWKNRETTEFTTAGIDVPFNLGDVSCGVDLPNAVGISNVSFDYIDVNTLTYPADWALWYSVSSFHKLQVYFVPSSAVVYYLDVYKNGVLFQTFSSSVVELFDIDFSLNGSWLNTPYVYTFKVRAAGALTFDCTIIYKFVAPYLNTSNVTLNYEHVCDYISSSNSITNVMDLAGAAPDQAVTEWLSGTLSEFNLTCYPTDTLTYQIEPLQNWYANGQTIDITEFVDTDEIEVERAKMYNEVSFEWQKSKSFINTAYEGFNGKEYGDLKQLFTDNDGGKFAIKLPFENILFSNIDTTNSNLQVGYCLTNAPDYKAYIPKPVKLYLNESTTPVSFYFDNGSVVELTSYIPFGQSTVNNSTNYSMNFGSEIDSLTNNPVSNSLFKTYYEAYLLNLFNSKTRKVTVKCVLPLDMLTDLTLDDGILIRDKRYIINDMVSDLTSGVVKLVLLSDWNAGATDSSTIYNVVSDANTVTAPINVPVGGYITVAAPIETQFITTVPTIPATFTAAFNLVITVPVNTTGAIRTQTIIVTGYNSSGAIVWTDTIIIIQAASSSYLLYEGLGTGYILQENFDKILL